MSTITKKTGKHYRVKTTAGWDECSFQTNYIDVVDGDGTQVVGDITALTTTDKTLAGAINELKAAQVSFEFDSSTGTLNIVTS